MRTALAVAAAVVVIDQSTKHWALDALADGHTIDIVGSLRFNLAFNEGMAFSQGAGLGPLIAVVAVVVVVVLLASLGRGRSRLHTCAVGLIVGGAVGNLIDRLLRGAGWLRGAVVDFMDLQWWPIFNVADIGVTVGAGLLLLGSLVAGPPRKPVEEADPDPAPARGDDRGGE